MRLKNIIQDEINLVDDELKNLEKSLALKKDILIHKLKASNKSKNDHETTVINQKNNDINNGNFVDLIGKDVLCLLKIIKTMIKQNTEDSIQLEIHENKKFKSCFKIFETMNFKRIDKRNSIMESKHRKNIRYANTLENLKLSIIKPEKVKPCIVRGNSAFNSLFDKEDQVFMTKNAKQYLNLLRNYNHQLGCYVRVNNLGSESVIKTNQEKNTIDPDYSYEWKYLAILIDRLIFVFFSVLIPLCLLLMFVKFTLMESVELD